MDLYYGGEDEIETIFLSLFGFSLEIYFRY